MTRKITTHGGLCENFHVLRIVKEIFGFVNDFQLFLMQRGTACTPDDVCTLV